MSVLMMQTRFTVPMNLNGACFSWHSSSMRMRNACMTSTRSVWCWQVFTSDGKAHSSGSEGHGRMKPAIEVQRPFSTRAHRKSMAVRCGTAYTTLRDRYRVDTEVKKSKFIAHAAPVFSAEEAMQFFAETRDLEASHNCFAYKIGEAVRFSDDGEPGGTAGRPILSSIEGSGLDNVAVLVVRFFGGTKLGAGGLVRAYGGAAAICLKEAPAVTILPKLDVQMIADYSQLGVLYQVIDSNERVEKVAEDYNDDGTVRLQLSIEEEVLGNLQVLVRDATNGKVTVDVIEEEVVHDKI
mmetsp:Transcript_10345/g.19622  ORF Transcript_10345/g.19622 Transcript_10345/m.19622 type:complete len:295 (-) Transcript_10345:115-999(-)